MKKIAIGVLACWVGIYANTGQAAEESPNFALSCNQDDLKLIEFRSASGDVTEDDMSIILQKNRVSKKLPVKPGWFHLTSQQSPTTSACVGQDQDHTSYPAFLVNNSALALFLLRDGRPSYSQLELALIDLKTHELLDIQSLGEMKTAFPVIQSYNKGYKIRVVRETNVANCDCAEAYTDDWKVVAFKKNKIVTKWLHQ